MAVRIRGRGHEIEDALRVIRLLVTSRPTITELSGVLGLDRRTAYRMLESLARVGLAVERHHEGPRVVRLGLQREDVQRVLWGPTPTQPGEVWRRVPGDDVYEVSNLGRVRRVWPAEGRRTRIIQPVKAGGGKKGDHLAVNARGKTTRALAGLVLDAFTPRPPGMVAARIDPSGDYRLSNLEWRPKGFGVRAWCAEEGCDNPAAARGWCWAHYQIHRRKRLPTEAEQ